MQVGSMKDYIFCPKRFILHDTTINKIIVKTGVLVLCFENGAYLLDDHNKFYNKADPCEIEIYIDNLDIRKLYQHINVRMIRKGKIKEIEFDSFLTLLSKNKLNVDIDYYSYFARSLLIKGFVRKFEILLEITEIKDIRLQSLR